MRNGVTSFLLYFLNTFDHGTLSRGKWERPGVSREVRERRSSNLPWNRFVCSQNVCEEEHLYQNFGPVRGKDPKPQNQKTLERNPRKAQSGPSQGQSASTQHGPALLPASPSGPCWWAGRHLGSILRHRCCAHGPSLSETSLCGT